MENHNDVRFEQAFEWAVQDNFRDEMTALPPENELAARYTFSAAFEKNMKKLLQSAALRESFFAIRRVAKGSAIAALVAISIFAASLAVSPQLRAAVLEMFVEFFAEYASFDSFSNNVEAQSTLEPSYIPQGFEEIMRHQNDTTISIMYGNSNGETVYFSSKLSGSTISANNEGVEYIQLKKPDIVYYLFESMDGDRFNRVVWNNDGYMYIVDGKMSLEELKLIAFSLK